MANRTVLGVSIAIAIVAGAGVWVKQQQQEAIAQARLLTDSVGAVETLSGYDSLSAAHDHLQGAIARLENAPKFPRQSELEELTFLRSQLQVVQQKLEPEQKARQNYQEAITRAMSASQLVQNPPPPPCGLGRGATQMAADDRPIGKHPPALLHLCRSPGETERISGQSGGGEPICHAIAPGGRIEQSGHGENPSREL
jgi:hypothetical protein